MAGAPIVVQFMVKDSKEYASTGGWGFAEFTDGKPDGEAVHRTCFVCHAPAKDHDFVFTRYSPSYGEPTFCIKGINVREK